MDANKNQVRPARAHNHAPVVDERHAQCARSHAGGQELDFREFVAAMWNYCTLSHEGLVQFVFQLYDMDVSNQLGAGAVAAALPPPRPA